MRRRASTTVVHLGHLLASTAARGTSTTTSGSSATTTRCSSSTPPTMRPRSSRPWADRRVVAVVLHPRPQRPHQRGASRWPQPRTRASRCTRRTPCCGSRSTTTCVPTSTWPTARASRSAGTGVAVLHTPGHSPGGVLPLRTRPRRGLLGRHPVPGRTGRHGPVATATSPPSSTRSAATCSPCRRHRRAHRARRGHHHRRRGSARWPSGSPGATEMDEPVIGSRPASTSSTSPRSRTGRRRSASGDYRVSTLGRSLADEGYIHASRSRSGRRSPGGVLLRPRPAPRAARDRPSPAGRRAAPRGAARRRRGVPAHLRAAGHRRSGQRHGPRLDVSQRAEHDVQPDVAVHRMVKALGQRRARSRSRVIATARRRRCWSRRPR